MILKSLSVGLAAMSILMAPAVTAAPAPAPPLAAAASALDGDWWGAIAAGAKSVRIGFHIHTGAGQASTLDSPDQGARGLPLSAVTVDGSKLHFTLPMANASFAGELGPGADTLTGVWTQGGGSAPLVMHRGAEPMPVAAVRKPRPQDPVKPYPYREEAVGYENAVQKVHLAGTLTLPQGKGPFPAVLLITGSGAQDRDETVLGHKPFLVLADDLTRRGIAVLRVDDRGVGGSTGVFTAATTADFATDAQASLAYLRARPEIDPKRVGVLGHSEGGEIGPMVAAQDPKVAFVVMLSGPGVAGSEILLFQQRHGLAQAKVPPAAIEKVMGFRRRVYDALKAPVDDATAEKQVSDILAEEAVAMGGKPEQGRSLAPQFAGHWVRWFANYDPAPALGRLRVPVLALGGSKDLQVPTATNLPAIRAALTHDKDATVLELPGLNHLFQTAATGEFDEYEKIDETIAPVALKTVGDWIVAHTRR